MQSERIASFTNFFWTTDYLTGLEQACDEFNENFKEIESFKLYVSKIIDILDNDVLARTEMSKLDNSIWLSDYSKFYPPHYIKTNCIKMNDIINNQMDDLEDRFYEHDAVSQRLKEKLSVVLVPAYKQFLSLKEYLDDYKRSIVERNRLEESLIKYQAAHKGLKDQFIPFLEDVDRVIKHRGLTNNLADSNQTNNVPLGGKTEDEDQGQDRGRTAQIENFEDTKDIVSEELEDESGTENHHSNSNLKFPLYLSTVIIITNEFELWDFLHFIDQKTSIYKRLAIRFRRCFSFKEILKSIFNYFKRGHKIALNNTELRLIIIKLVNLKLLDRFYHSSIFEDPTENDSYYKLSRQAFNFIKIGPYYEAKVDETGFSVSEGVTKSYSYLKNKIENIEQDHNDRLIELFKNRSKLENCHTSLLSRYDRCYERKYLMYYDILNDVNLAVYGDLFNEEPLEPSNLLRHFTANLMNYQIFWDLHRHSRSGWYWPRLSSKIQKLDGTSTNVLLDIFNCELSKQYYYSRDSTTDFKLKSVPAFLLSLLPLITQVTEKLSNPTDPYPKDHSWNCELQPVQILPFKMELQEYIDSANGNIATGLYRFCEAYNDLDRIPDRTLVILVQAWLLELPTSLIPPETYEKFKYILKNNPPGALVVEELSLIPRENLATLLYLLEHLIVNVSKYDDLFQNNSVPFLHLIARPGPDTVVTDCNDIWLLYGVVELLWSRDTLDELYKVLAKKEERYERESKLKRQQDKLSKQQDDTLESSSAMLTHKCKDKVHGDKPKLHFGLEYDEGFPTFKEYKSSRSLRSYKGRRSY